MERTDKDEERTLLLTTSIKCTLVSCLVPSMSMTAFQFFAINAKLPIPAILSSKDFTTAKKLPAVGLNVMITGPRV